MNEKTVLALFGMLLVAYMISVWVMTGHDGAVFMAGLAIVAGLAGYILPSPLLNRKVNAPMDRPIGAKVRSQTEQPPNRPELSFS